MDRVDLGQGRWRVRHSIGAEIAVTPETPEAADYRAETRKSLTSWSVNAIRFSGISFSTIALSAHYACCPHCHLSSPVYLSFHGYQIPQLSVLCHSLEALLDIKLMKL